MNEFKVLGIKEVNFTDEQGKPISGCQLFLIGQTHEPGWREGYEVLKTWISADGDLAPVVAGLCHDDHVLVDFSRKGKVIGIARV